MIILLFYILNNQIYYMISLNEQEFYFLKKIK